ncbi:MAG: polysaccharide deacetylase, partial [Clostridia bacterium]|nr:polysaccharide deacetylase [Clostridia bacterium]
PSGSVNSRVVSEAESLGHKTIMWSKDTIDWRDKDSKLVFNRATQDIQNGFLILMHPTKHTALALGDIIKNLKNQGFNLTTVSNCIEGLV